MTAQHSKLPPGFVDIRGSAYKTVAKRLHDFREATKGSRYHYGILTTLLEDTEDRVRFKAEIVVHLTAGPAIIGTGHAEEKRIGHINELSAVENCETSAIGRALAACGYGGSDLEYASADEMARHLEAAQKLEQGKMSPVKMREYVEGMMKAVHDDDGPHLLQLIRELSMEQQLWLWNQLRSYERRAIKELRAKAEQQETQGD